MPRKVTRDDIEEWMDLREKGYSFREIGEKTDWNEETVRKHVREEEKKGEEESEEEIEEKEEESELRAQAKAIEYFESGKNWKDLVKEKICTISKAKELQEEWEESESGGEDIGDRLTELRESVFEESRRVSGGNVSFPKRYREMVSTESRAQEGGNRVLGKTYCFGCYKALIFVNPHTPVSEIIKSLKMIINYLEERTKEEE
ncbi:hypothetical protein AKJ65_02270 [candidate division MSBL1 archaeon SCGC-AAA259E19]|uniref:Uncharacterized protein n=2 Tax=candidate division MSBL1 TaxID=215777 RepID=A0A133UGY5_9EURY|nr:hypothetical protein AKJ66_01925 [candidate division MSBL1 archaeon SCGC-AAA259E22]KXA95201.1 hypothetical protein AKJ65_02270 [candidate division MSBL1 archaeon SCGC-AAA259E19]